MEPERPRFGEPVLHTPRLGQGIFRVQVLDVRNGMDLRTDIHRLFDKGYVTIDEEMRFVVGGRLKEDVSNGRSYCGLHGTAAKFPPDPHLSPAADVLGWHREHVFLG